MHAIFTNRPLREIADVRAGSPAPQGSEYFDPSGIPFVRVQDVGKYGRTMALTETKDRINEHAIKNLRPVLGKKGTIVFPKSGAAINTNSRAILGADAYVVSHLAMVNAFEELVLTDWLYYFFCLVDMRKFSRTAALPSLRLSDLREILIPCPELEEQRRIVARIKECMDRVDEIECLYTKILKEAYMVLPSILNEEFISLSKNYKKAIIKDITLESKYGTSKKCSEEVQGTAVLRIPNIIGGFVNFDRLKYCLLGSKEKEKIILKNGDVLFVRTNGSRDLVGRCAVYEDKNAESNYAFASYLIRLRLDQTKIIPHFLSFFLNSTQGRSELNKKLRTSAGQYNINSEMLKSIEFPLPPINIQKRIVAVLNDRQNIVHQLHSELKKSIKIESNLRDSILRKAFAGEL